MDTHVGRVSKRLGLTGHDDKDAVRIEQDLMELIPKEWIDFSHRMIHHGRRICGPQTEVRPMPLGRHLPTNRGRQDMIAR